MRLRSICRYRVRRFYDVYNLTHYLPDYIGSDSMKPAQLKYILLYFTSTIQLEYFIVRHFGSIWESYLMGSSNTCLVLTTSSNVVWFLLHLIGMCLAAGFTYAFSYVAYAIASSATDWSTPSLPPFMGLMHKALFMTLSLVICSSGLSCIFLLLENLYKHSEPFRVSRSGRYLAQFPGIVVFKRIHEKYWLPTSSSHRRERLFYLKRVLIRQGPPPLCNPARLSIANIRAVIKLPFNLFCLVVTSATLVGCAWVSAQWIALLMVSMDSPWLLGWLLESVIVVPAVVFYSCLMLYALYMGVSDFLVVVRRDAGVELHNDVPV